MERMAGYMEVLTNTVPLHKLVVLMFFNLKNTIVQKFGNSLIQRKWQWHQVIPQSRTWKTTSIIREHHLWYVNSQPSWLNACNLLQPGSESLEADSYAPFFMCRIRLSWYGIAVFLLELKESLHHRLQEIRDWLALGKRVGDQRTR